MGIGLSHLVDQLQSFHAWHALICHQDCSPVTFLMESLQSLLSAGGAADFEAVLHPHQLFAQVLGRRLFVVND